MEMMTEMMFPMMRILVDLIYLKWKLFIMSFLMLKKDIGGGDGDPSHGIYW
nr:hypothetical protein Q903MT_gene2267 [Picea sitchensis]